MYLWFKGQPKAVRRGGDKSWDLPSDFLAYTIYLVPLLLRETAMLLLNRAVSAWFCRQY